MALWYHSQSPDLQQMKPNSIRLVFLEQILGHRHEKRPWEDTRDEMAIYNLKQGLRVKQSLQTPWALASRLGLLELWSNGGLLVRTAILISAMLPLAN